LKNIIEDINNVRTNKTLVSAHVSGVSAAFNATFSKTFSFFVSSIASFDNSSLVEKSYIQFKNVVLIPSFVTTSNNINI
jgi:hypothetical protein